VQLEGLGKLKKNSITTFTHFHEAYVKFLVHIEYQYQYRINNSHTYISIISYTSYIRCDNFFSLDWWLVTFTFEPSLHSSIQGYI
jgi:hypothetical protein